MGKGRTKRVRRWRVRLGREGSGGNTLLGERIERGEMGGGRKCREEDEGKGRHDVSWLCVWSCVC